MCACLPTCGLGRGNRAPCAGRSFCASFAPLGVYIYAFGSQSCPTRLILAGSARLGPTKLRFCSKTLFLWAFRSAFSLAPQNATRFSAVTRPETKPRLAPLVEFGAVLGDSASHTSSDRLRRLGLRPRVIPRSLRRRSRRLRGDTRRNASSPGYRLLALRRVSPRIRRTASVHVAQFGTCPLVSCLTFHKARFSS